MMIRGLSDQRRLPRCGKIKLGVMVHPPQGKPYPKATDYFVIPPIVAKVLGEKPKELPIMFPGDDPERLFPQMLKMYRAAGLYCAGDKSVARRWTEKGELKEISCPCPYLESGDCGPVATLNFLLPDVPGIGVWQIETSNQRSIISLNTAFEQYAHPQMFGGLAGIPFLLKLEPQKIQRFDEKQGIMVKQTIHVLRLDSPYTIREIIEWCQKAGKPVEALMPASLPEEEEAPEIPPAGVSPDLEPWDHSRCFEAAKKLGVSPEDYTLYLLGVYAVDTDNLSPKALAEQSDLLSKALADPKVGEAFAGAMRSVARKMQKRGNGGTQATML